MRYCALPDYSFLMTMVEASNKINLKYSKSSADSDTQAGSLTEKIKNKDMNDQSPPPHLSPKTITNPYIQAP